MRERYGVPFNRVAPAGRELEYVADAVARSHVAGDGHYTRRCAAFLESELGVARVLLTTSCTHALEMAALLLSIAPGDEVILPSFTFVSVANAFVLRGARPVFADIRPDTLNIDESRLAALITGRTRAIVVVHYGGVGCEMDVIAKVASMHGVVLVEDNAHGLFGKYRSKPLGTFGALATLSFHETKNLTCGEGGALLVNDPQYIDRAEVIREKGTNRRRYFAGMVDKYTWEDIGSSYLPSELLAAYLCGQIEARGAIQAARQRVWLRYAAELAAWAAARRVDMPAVPAHCEQPAHLFYLLMPSRERRDDFIEHLKARDILAVFHYLPLHLSAMGFRYGCRPGDCPVTEDISERLVRLPIYPTLDDGEQSRVLEAVREW